MNKAIIRFFDSIFNNLVFKTDYEFEVTDNSWSGFVLNKNGKDILIVGHPNDSVPTIWFSDGTYFSSYYNFFNLTPPEFHNLMRDYINDRYGFKIKKLT